MRTRTKLRPVRRLIADTILAFEAHMGKYTLAASVPLLTAIVVVAVSQFIGNFGATGYYLESILAAIGQIFFAIVLVLTSTSLIILARDPKMRIIEVFREARVLFFPYLAVVIIVFLVLYGIYVLFMIPAALFSLAAKVGSVDALKHIATVFYIYGSGLSVIPMFIMGALLSLSSILVVADGKRYIAALETSKAYVAPVWVLVLLRGLVFLCLVAVAAMLVQYFALSITQNEPLSRLVVYTLFTLFVMPLGTIFSYLIYTDLKTHAGRSKSA